MRCELDRCQRLIQLNGDYVGVGAWTDGMLVERMYGAGNSRKGLWEVADSGMVMFASGALGVGQSLETQGQPLKFHDWLFALAGEVSHSDQVRERIVAELPELLRKALPGATLAEATFGLFLKVLRSRGLLGEHIQVNALDAAAAVYATAAGLNAAVRETGSGERGDFALMAANSKVLVATRHGEPGLHYVSLQGEIACRRCRLRADAKVTEPKARDHLRRKSILISTVATPGLDGDVPPGGSIVVSQSDGSEGPIWSVLPAR